MNWSVQPARETFPGFAAEWDKLNTCLYGGHPLFDSRFIGALLDHFGNGKESLCIHRTDDDVDGALILCPRRFGRWTLFLPSQMQIGALLVKDAHCLETLMPALPGYAWTIDLLAIDPHFEPNWLGLALPRTMVRHNLTMAVETRGDFSSYWNARPNNLRKNLRRYRNRSSEHTVAIRLTNDQTGIPAAVRRYAEIESAGWKANTGTAIGMDNLQGRFYEQVLSDFAASGQAKVVELWFDDMLAASRLLICHDRMWIILKTTYDESCAALAPGRQLLYETLQLAFPALTEGAVEFYTNATRDQAEWATDLRYICHHQLYRNPTVANLYGSVRALKQRLAGRKGPEPTQSFDPTNVTMVAAPGELPASMLSLFDAAASREVELSLDWFANLQAAVFADDQSGRYCCASLNDSPRAVLPIRISREGGRCVPKIESLSNFYTSIYSPLVAPSTDATELGRLLLAASAEFDDAHVMNFHPMASDSCHYDAMVVALRSIGWIPFRYFSFGNWFLKVDRSWQDYLEQREGALRNTIKRKGKRFRNSGGTYEVVANPTNVDRAIDDFNALYRRRWKKTEPYPAFIPGLIHWLAASGKLRLGVARIDGKPVAAQLWIVNGGKASIYKLAYDEEYAAYAPGTLLTAHLLEHVIDRDGVDEVDYLIGDEHYKQSWMSHRRERWGIVAYNPQTATGLLLLARELFGRGIRKLIGRPRKAA
jgi:CelD/BcsL family acetyltransferase involved in cellulose biosynthesis